MEPIPACTGREAGMHSSSMYQSTCLHKKCNQRYSV
uniref:Uncharacterized protein n=1 Tax=Anguilla anguilla TaxID=7936 RepID=A0A0E9Q173_ANGAN